MAGICNLITNETGNILAFHKNVDINAIIISLKLLLETFSVYQTFSLKNCELV